MAIARQAGMTRLRLLPSLLLVLPAAAACGNAAPPADATPPAAEVPAPTRLSVPNVPEPPAPAPTAPGTYASMTPPFMQHTPPRPKTRGAAPSTDSLPSAP
jgi:hypothetical protein